MNKSKIFTLFSQLHVLFAIGILVTVGVYVTSFPSEMFGLIDKGLFTIEFTTGIDQTNGEDIIVSVFNSALIATLVVLVFNIFTTVYVFVLDKTKKQQVKDQTLINLMLSGLLVVGQLAYYVFVPEQVNGTISHNPLFTKFDVLSDTQVYGWNFVVILAVLYLAYNGYMLFTSSKKTPTKIDK